MPARGRTAGADSSLCLAQVGIASRVSVSHMALTAPLRGHSDLANTGADAGAIRGHARGTRWPTCARAAGTVVRSASMLFGTLSGAGARTLNDHSVSDQRLNGRLVACACKVSAGMVTIRLHSSGIVSTQVGSPGGRRGGEVGLSLIGENPGIFGVQRRADQVSSRPLACCDMWAYTQSAIANDVGGRPWMRSARRRFASRNTSRRT